MNRTDSTPPHQKPSQTWLVPWDTRRLSVIAAHLCFSPTAISPNANRTARCQHSPVLNLLVHDLHKRPPSTSGVKFVVSTVPKGLLSCGARSAYESSVSRISRRFSVIYQPSVSVKNGSSKEFSVLTSLWINGPRMLCIFWTRKARQGFHYHPIGYTHLPCLTTLT